MNIAFLIKNMTKHRCKPSKYDRGELTSVKGILDSVEVDRRAVDSIVRNREKQPSTPSTIIRDIDTYNPALAEALKKVGITRDLYKKNHR